MTAMLTELLTTAVALAMGLGSALVSLLNAEAYAVLAASRTAGPAGGVLLIVALALGQTLGKLVLVEAGRRARTPRFLRHGDRTARSRRIAERLRERRAGMPLVLVSASVGVPPLAVVSVAAGIAGQPRRDFAVAALTGRLVRFAVIVVPVAFWASA